MKDGRRGKISPEKKLGMLAMKFRGTRDEAQRCAIAGEYARTVSELTASNKWRRIPPLEDQLPDEWMPKEFFTYWSLGDPQPREEQRG